MDKAKQAVNKFISRDGKHTTTVDQEVRSAVTDEHIKPHQHENITTAVDKEVHQDHHHTTVQPVKHREVLPEQHRHQMAGVQERSFEHGNEDEVRATLERDAAKYKDSRVTHDTTRSTTDAPMVAGERVHHHVHEHVQPVIQKETIAPEVVHTTVPIHETHHAKAMHHGTTTLPTKTLNEFTQEQGVPLTGRETTKVTDYEGCPEQFSRGTSGQTTRTGEHTHSHEHGHSHSHGDERGTGLTGKTNTADSAGKDRAFFSGRGDNESGVQNRNLRQDEGQYSVGGSGSGSSGLRGDSLNKAEPRFGSGVTGSNDPKSTGVAGEEERKASLVDKLNPFKDADHDGKKGVMS